MEIIQFQQQRADINPVRKVGKFKGRSRSNNNNNNKKFVGVRQRPSGRWVAEIKDTTQKIRMWLGTFESAEEAARAYDEAACLLRGSNTRTNFVTHVSTNSPLAFRIQNLLSNKKEGKQQGAHVSKRFSSGGTSADSFSQHTDIFSDAYKPDLSSCIQEFDSKSSQSDLPWGFGPGFDMFSLPEKADDLLEFSEFDRMKVERQISASLYAMNGVQEYMETVNDPAEALWDLPPLCSLLC